MKVIDTIWVMKNNIEYYFFPLIDTSGINIDYIGKKFTGYIAAYETFKNFYEDGGQVNTLYTASLVQSSKQT